MKCFDCGKDAVAIVDVGETTKLKPGFCLGCLRRRRNTGMFSFLQTQFTIDDCYDKIKGKELLK